ncbi:MAG: phasin family protein [Hyphomicrobiaceae bacterium]|nr:phasin family protein [Hyphomicrobiaceae bacterium]
MFDKPTLEIPAPVRQMAENNIEQTRQAYSQFLMFAQQANMMMMKAQGDGFRAVLDMQGKAMRLAQDNVEANFKFASELARARDIGEYADIQRRYAEGQVKAFQQQNEELARTMADLARKMTPG